MILTVVTMFVGLFVILAMSKKGIKGSVLYGMLVASVIYWIGSFAFLHTNPFASLATASFLPPFADMAKVTLFKFNFAGFMEIGWFTAITLIITFCIIDMFDTIGTLVGTASRAGMVDEKGDMPNMKEALLSDAIGTIAGCMVKDGKVTRDSQVRVLRDNIVIHEGEIGSLQRFKDAVKEVTAGYECGMSVVKYNDIKEGDIFECFVMQEVKR